MNVFEPATRPESGEALALDGALGLSGELGEADGSAAAGVDTIAIAASAAMPAVVTRRPVCGVYGDAARGVKLIGSSVGWTFTASYGA